MSHSSHSCCYATHNADGGLLEVARLIQVLPRGGKGWRSLVQKKPSFHGPLRGSNSPWRSNVSGEGRRQLCRRRTGSAERPSPCARRDWVRHLAACQESFHRGTQSHAEKKHTGMHVSLHGLLFHSSLKISEWFSKFYNRHHVAHLHSAYTQYNPSDTCTVSFSTFTYGTCAAF